MPVPPWFESIADALGTPEGDWNDRYNRLKARLLEFGRQISSEQYVNKGFRITRIFPERDNGWDFYLMKTSPPLPLTLPDRIHLSISVDITSIPRTGRECLIRVVAEGGSEWKETFEFPVLLVDWLK